MMNSDEIEKDPIKEEIDSLKIEMLRELRDIKQNIKDSNLTSIDLLKEIK